MAGSGQNVDASNFVRVPTIIERKQASHVEGELRINVPYVTKYFALTKVPKVRSVLVIDCPSLRYLLATSVTSPRTRLHSAPLLRPDSIFQNSLHFGPSMVQLVVLEVV